MEHYKSIRSALSPRNGALKSAKEDSAGLTLRCLLRDWRQKVGAKHWKELANTCQKYLHVFAVGFGKLCAASLILVKCESLDLSGLGKKTGFEVSHMSLSQVFILADEHDGRHPLLGFVLPKPFANNLGLADVGSGC